LGAGASCERDRGGHDQRRGARRQPSHTKTSYQDFTLPRAFGAQAGMRLIVREPHPPIIMAKQLKFANTSLA
jgi:hypothetical protein